MAGAYVRFDPRSDDRFSVVGYGELGRHDDGEPFAPLDVAQHAYLHSLGQAMRRYLRYETGTAAGPMLFRLSDAPAEYFNEDYSAQTPVALCMTDGVLHVEVTVFSSDGTTEADYVAVVTPFLERRGSELLRTEAHEVDDFVCWEFRCSIPPRRGATVGDAHRFGEEVAALLNALDDGEVSPATALDLLRAGRYDLFKGQPESDWLDAKGAPYVGPLSKFELAKDVAVRECWGRSHRSGTDDVRRRGGRCHHGVS